jgi:hypothetical protein
MATVRIQIRRGTASQWTGANPVLAAGEVGLETDTRKIKFGDGSTAWSSLSYLNPGDIDELSQDAINAALTMGSGLSKSYNDSANTLTISLDTGVVATLSDIQTLTNKTISSANNTITITSSNVSDFAEAAQDLVNDAIVAGVGLDKVYNDNSNTITLDIDSTVLTTSGTQTLTNKTMSVDNNTISGVAASSFVLSDSSGNLDGSAAQKVIPSGIVVGTSDTQTLTNKSLNLSSNTLSGTLAEFNTALIDANFATLGGEETLSNKTLTTPTIVSFANASHTHTDASGGGALTASAISNFDTQVRTNRLDQMASPAASVSLNSQKITNLATPTNSTDATTKAYVDAAVEGLHVHASVKAATTANVALASALENGDTLDGVTLATGDRVLVKNQTTKSENGIYIVQNSGQPTRATDFDTAAEVDSGDFVFVGQGTTQANTGWVQINTPATIGTDPIEFVQFSGAGTYLAGTGLTLTGNTFSINTGTTVDLNTAQTLTNKTMTLGNNFISGTLSQFNAAVTDADLASLATAQTLTNKTISGADNTLNVRIANDVSGLGTGIATFLADPTSFNLASAITNETGSGLLVFATSPAFGGTPTAPTADLGTNTTQIATTGFVQAAIAVLDGGAA